MNLFFETSAYGGYTGHKLITSKFGKDFADRAMALFKSSAVGSKTLCGNYLLFALSLVDEDLSEDHENVFDVVEGFESAKEGKIRFVSEWPIATSEAEDARICARCGKKSVICLAARQTRSADEPEHYTYKCLVCGVVKH